MTDGGVNPSRKFTSVLESLMWQLRGLSKNLLQIIRSKWQSLPRWTLDLELSWLTGVMVEVQLTNTCALQ